MKKAILLLVFGLILNVGFAKKPVSILSTDSSIIYFKLDKEIRDAVLEITDESGKVLVSEKITRKKVIVDFYFKTAGKYFIKITCGSLVENFTFENVVNESANEMTETGDDRILVTQ